MTTNDNQTENKKVYELAKELGMNALALVDKLKDLSISVKNHMSDLTNQDVTVVLDFFTKLKETQASAGKKGAKPARKSVSRRPTAETEDKEEAARLTIKLATKLATKPGTKPGTKLGTKQKTTAKITKAAAAAADEAAKKRITIRRRTTSTGEVETVVKTENTTDAIAIQEAAEMSEESTLLVSDSDASYTQSSPGENETVTDTATPAIAGPKGSGTEPKDTELKGSGLKMHSLYAAKKDGMLARNENSILTIIQHDQKKDESKKPVITPVTKSDGRSPQKLPLANNPLATAISTRSSGIINIGKEAIDKMAEEENLLKRKGRAIKATDPTDVKIADYRAKKELIFLPKKKKIVPTRDMNKTRITKPAAHKRVIKLDSSVTVNDLAQRMGVKVGELLKKLIGMGVMATINQAIDPDTATLIATDFGFEVTNVTFNENQTLFENEDAMQTLKPRPPIVTVMGHVDHGKTSLLDAIRSTKVVTGEAGGITQHIGAYTVEVNDKYITFIDTPGHEAFTTMRARGANATDIVILVVAADDGVMPQTKEALSHAKAAGVPIIVAINKIDKPTANPERILKELADLDLLAEEWGGQSMFLRVSATQKTGIKELLEAILLQAEVLELKANPDRKAWGLVLEAKLDKSRGPVASILVKKGTLKTGDTVVAGHHVGRVRNLINDKGMQLKQIGPSFAAELVGLQGVPVAGDEFHSVTDEAVAREVAEHRLEKIKMETSAAKGGKATLETLFSKHSQSDIKELNVIIKTDVFGSAEAIKDSLMKIPSQKVKVNVIFTAPGGITESDVMLACASNAVIIGFNVRPETKAMSAAVSQGIQIKCYGIIYELIDDVKKAMAGLLEKKALEKYLGRAEVREVFSIPKIGTIAGCTVTDGKIQRNASVRLLRDSRVIYTGKLASLKRFKDDAKEVAQGYECGMGIENFNDIKIADVIEAFVTEMIAQEIADLVSLPEKPESEKAELRA